MGVYKTAKWMYKEGYDSEEVRRVCFFALYMYGFGKALQDAGSVSEVLCNVNLQGAQSTGNSIELDMDTVYTGSDGVSEATSFQVEMWPPASPQSGISAVVTVVNGNDYDGEMTILTNETYLDGTSYDQLAISLYRYLDSYGYWQENEVSLPDIISSPLVNSRLLHGDESKFERAILSRASSRFAESITSLLV